ncbi:single-stranded DNA-binding protein [Cutibacterium avidum]|uniref:Single-stranded DNA-binding protein n=1 Tax=Cutibacterium avidum TaxID=33010 RepID=A0A3E2DMD7_9ACTN|nr:single-stranded DNA-binding protein [Cutibacterium avidum]RFT46530.1 single-stranded DNA-binding protein [Cutibacterium avidum]TMT54761.1 single-stranded DNA-binding protein [Cutibacterium avidum]
MNGETPITVIGNLTADPELRFTNNGTPVANFTVASTPRKFDKQRNEWVNGEALFLACSVWNQVAENVAESLSKGMHVIVQGNLKARSWQDRDGNRRTSYEIDVNEIGPSLRYATAKVTRSQPGGRQPGGWPQQSGNQQDNGKPPQAAQQQADPWTQQTDAAPF